MSNEFEERLLQILDDFNHHEFNLNEAKNSIVGLIKESLPKKRYGKHLGHSEDDGYCYDCRENSKEEDLGSFGDHLWNAAIEAMENKLGVEG